MFGFFGGPKNEDEAIDDVVDQLKKNGNEGGMKSATRNADRVDSTCDKLYGAGKERYEEQKSRR